MDNTENKTPDTNEEVKPTPNAEETKNNSEKPKTEDEIRAELQKEYEKMADKRVTDAIKKKEKEWADKQAKEKMSEDERKQVEERERAEAQAKKDYELTIKGLRLDVVDAIAELGLDAGFRNLIAVEDLANISDDEERKAKLTERVKGMKALFDAEVKKAVEVAKTELLKGTTPPTGGEKKADTDKYSEYKKAGNVKGMIGEKMNKFYHPEE